MFVSDTQIWSQDRREILAWIHDDIKINFNVINLSMPIPSRLSDFAHDMWWFIEI